MQDNTQAYFDYVKARKAQGATAEEIAKDPATPSPESVTFELRQNVTFSDGQPLTADDVVWTYNWIMNPKVEAPRERATSRRSKA